jgi:diacylglycerol O-acyltransferase / wax synthase
VQRLTGADATFLYGQTRNSHMEIASCIVVDASELPRGEALLDLARSYLEPRLHLAPPLRRRLVRVPFELDHPLWIEDPDFDLDYHLRHAALPAPGTMDQLADLVGRLLSRPLDHSRPLWEMYLVEGLEDDRAALFVKSHHAAVDGVAAFQLVAALMDLWPDAPPPPPPEEPWRPDEVPSDLQLVAGAAANLARQPVRGFKATRRLLRSALQARREHGSVTAVVGQTGAPHTRFNDPMSPHRRVAFLDLPLDGIKDIKTRAGTKVNDVVLAIVGGGLRRYLDRHGELPEEPLLAFVPVSARTDGTTDANATSMMYVGLATDETDPRRRLERIAAASAEAKGRLADLGPSMLVDMTEYTGPALAHGAFRVVESLRLNERVRLGGNVVVSNIPGPPVPLYTTGAPIEHVYPIGPLTDGTGLNITMLSYLGHLGLSVAADRELVPDIDDLVGDLRAAYDELRSAVVPPDDETGSGPSAAPEQTAARPAKEPVKKAAGKSARRPTKKATKRVAKKAAKANKAVKAKKTS